MIATPISVTTEAGSVAIAEIPGANPEEPTAGFVFTASIPPRAFIVRLSVPEAERVLDLAIALLRAAGYTVEKARRA